MDPATLAAAAVVFVTPYLLVFGKEVAVSAAAEGVWEWIKGRLTSAAGVEAVGDAERDPKKPANLKGLEAALTKVLDADPDAAKALAALLKAGGATLSTQTATVTGDNNKVGQAGGGSTVTIG